MTRFLILAACLALTACATDGEPPIPTPKTVLIATPVHCKPNLGPAPDYADAAIRVRAAKDDDERAALYAAGRKQRIRRIAELEAALAACG